MKRLIEAQKLQRKKDKAKRKREGVYDAIDDGAAEESDDSEAIFAKLMGQDGKGTALNPPPQPFCCRHTHSVTHPLARRKAV